MSVYQDYHGVYDNIPSANNLSSYFGTNYGLSLRQEYSLIFALQNGSIVKPHNSSTGSYIGGRYFIPINRASVSQFSKLHIKAKHAISDAICYLDAWVSEVVNGQMVDSTNKIQSGMGNLPMTLTDYYLDITGISNIDYVAFEGAQGMPVIEYIALEAPEPDPDWEILLVAQYSYDEVMLIDSDGNCTYYNSLQNVTGRLLRYEGTDSQGAWSRKVYANHDCTASYGDGTSSTLTNTNYSAGDLIATKGRTSGSGYALFVLAKKNPSARIPFEIGLSWLQYDSGEEFLIKANESEFVPWAGHRVAGDYINIDFVTDPRGQYKHQMSKATLDSYQIKAADSAVSDYWIETGTLMATTAIALAPYEA